MPRAVAPWTWKRALRDHGPDDRGFLLAMLMLNTYMDNSGYAYPSQSTWASASRISTRHLQRHLALAQQLGWVSVVNAGRGGQGWRHNGYRCCVPDHVELEEKDEALADVIASQVGDIESQNNGGDRIASSRIPITAEGDDNNRVNVTTGGAHRDDIRSEKVATPTWRSNSRSENSRPITHAPYEALGDVRGLAKEMPSRTTADEIQRRRLQAAEIVAAEEAKKKAALAK